MIYDAQAIQKVLPHRAPFLLIDRITELEAGSSATGIHAVSIADPVFTGHFPDEAIYPGVLIIEAMAQVGAFAILSEDENKGKKAYFVRIEKARFLKPVRPGDTLVLTTRLLRRRLHIGFAEGEAFVDGEKVCEAEIAFALEK